MISRVFLERKVDCPNVTTYNDKEDLGDRGEACGDYKGGECNLKH